MTTPQSVFEFYKSLVLFQTRALAYVAEAGNNDELIAARIATVTSVTGQLDAVVESTYAISKAVHCGSGLVNCHGICVPPEMCNY